MNTAFTPIIKQCLQQNLYHCKCASVVKQLCEYDMAGTLHSHPGSDCTRDCQISDFAFGADYIFVRFFTTAPLPPVLIFNQIYIGDFEPSPMKHDNVTETFFLFHKLKMQIGHFIPNLAEIVKFVSTLWLSQMQSQNLIQIFPKWSL